MFKNLIRRTNVADPGGLIRQIAQKPKNNPGVFVHIDEMKIFLIFFKKTLDFFACIAYNIDNPNNS